MTESKWSLHEYEFIVTKHIEFIDINSETKFTPVITKKIKL